MWFFYSLFFAIWSAVSIFLIKRTTKYINPLPLLFILFLFAIPATFVLLQFVGGIPATTPEFYLYMFIAALLDTVMFVSFFSAVHQSEISLLAPISSFSPVFTTIIAIFALGEIPTFLKLVGILIVVFGAYLLNISDLKHGFLSPFKNLFSHRGVRLYLLANFLLTITPIFQKKAIFETTPQVPLYASFIGMCLVALFLSPFTLRKSLSYKKEVPSHLKTFLIYGVGTALAQLAAYTAFSLTHVGYVTTVMRLSGLFSVFIGGFFLKEGRIKERLLGAGVMILGTLILAL